MLVKCICSLNQVSKKTSKFDITHVLSLNDHSGIKVYLHPKIKVQHKTFIFEDIEFEDSFLGKSPTKDDVKAIMDWAKSLPDNANVLVHCYAGVSRSSAAAIIIELARGSGTVSEIYEYMKMIRPVMMPNSLMLRYVDEILDLKGELIKINEEFSKKQLAIKMPWMVK